MHSRTPTLANPSDSAASPVPAQAADPEGIADARFRCTDAERACFEAGIKLGALFHQFIGTPVSRRNAEALAAAMEGALRTQPYVESARVELGGGRLRSGAHLFDYDPLGEDMIAAEVVVRYRGSRAVARLRWVEELGYPLMSVEVG